MNNTVPDIPIKPDDPVSSEQETYPTGVILPDTNIPDDLVLRAIKNNELLNVIVYARKREFVACLCHLKESVQNRKNVLSSRVDGKLEFAASGIFDTRTNNITWKEAMPYQDTPHIERGIKFEVAAIKSSLRTLLR